MVYRHAIDATTYTFPDLRDLLARATPPRSGDRLAGIAAASAEQMIAARMALSDLPLRQFLNEAVIPYEDCEVTRLIVDSHDAVAFAPVAAMTVGAPERVAGHALVCRKRPHKCGHYEPNRDTTGPPPS